jgi:endonuclease-3
MNPSKRRAIYETLQALNPHPQSELEYSTPYELLVAVVLSAQATDKSVNLATRALYKEANTPAAMVRLGEERLADYIKTIGLFRTKAKNVIGLSRLLLEKHSGAVPRDRAALEALPGVGRKTANVVLGNAFGKDEGFVVDTHVGRLSRRLGFTRQTDPVKVETDLNALVPKGRRTMGAHLLIAHGRSICAARKPRCGDCPVDALCPKIGV